MLTRENESGPGQDISITFSWRVIYTGRHLAQNSTVMADLEVACKRFLTPQLMQQLRKVI